MRLGHRLSLTLRLRLRIWMGVWARARVSVSVRVRVEPRAFDSCLVRPVLAGKWFWPGNGWG